MLATALLLALVQAPQAPTPSRVVVEPASVRLPVDSALTLSVAAYDAAGRPLASTPRWFAVPAEVVQVDQDGRIRGLRQGSARVTAVVDGVFGVAEVTVAPASADHLSLEAPESLPAGTSAPVAVSLRTASGTRLPADAVRLESRSPEVLAVDEDGRVWARRPGTAVLVATSGGLTREALVTVTANRAVDYRLEGLRPGARTGDVVRLRVTGLDASGRDVASAAAPAWSVSGAGAQVWAEGAEGVFVAEEPGVYRVTALIGESELRSAVVTVEPRRHDLRLERVGHGAITGHHSGDTWVFEGVDGRDYAYIGTFMHDWLKVWDVTAPERPVLTDSLWLDARRINDVKIHPNGRVAVVTREQASTRRNGLVLLGLENPAHPEVLSEYNRTVSGGVHNTWIRGDLDLVYACHNGTNDLHIIDISDPRAPREVGRWGLDKPNKTLHDVIVQDGYAYLSYWDDGLVVLDVGAATHGGTPTAPAFVSQFRYPQGHTHVAWRHGRYVFIGDEIFPPDWAPGGPIDARGYVHVVDYSDMEKPVEVARYEVPEAGAHNLWVEDDRLYVGYYQAGLRVVDVSGELRGDLYRQGREIAALKTMSQEHAYVPNWPMTWGAQVFKGRIYSSDLNSGLWITRLVPERPIS